MHVYLFLFSGMGEVEEVQEVTGSLTFRSWASSCVLGCLLTLPWIYRHMQWKTEKKETWFIRVIQSQRDRSHPHQKNSLLPWPSDVSHVFTLLQHSSLSWIRIRIRIILRSPKIYLTFLPSVFQFLFFHTVWKVCEKCESSVQLVAARVTQWIHAFESTLAFHTQEAHM